MCTSYGANPLDDLLMSRKLTTRYMCSPSVEPTYANPFPAITTSQFFFFWLIHYSHTTYLDHGEVMYSPFPVRCPRDGGTLQAPLCPPPRPVPRRCDAHQGDYKGKEAERA